MNRYGYSISEIAKFTLPLILNSMLINLMLTVDRMILAKYSIESMNAAGLASSFLAIVIFFGLSITSIATVYVGQLNGMKAYDKIGRPVWQMVYFSIALGMIVILLSFFCDQWELFPDSCKAEGRAYLKPLLMLAWLPAMSSAFSSFFMGRRKSLIIIAVFLISSIINIALNFLFVFGVKNLIPAMGAKGSAYATNIAELFIVCAFAVIFLNKHNRQKYNTGDYSFYPSLMKDCIKTGFPISLSKVMSLLAWFCLLSFFNYSSVTLAAIEGFAFIIWSCFVFFADGGGRALASMGANLIGKDRIDCVENLLKLFLKINVYLCILLSIPMVFYQAPVLHIASITNDTFANNLDDISFVLVSMWIIILTDGFFYFICGILNAGGDTQFPMKLELCTLWGGVVIPVAILFFSGHLTSIRIVYTILPITQLINVAVIYKRYKKYHWYRKLI